MREMESVHYLATPHSGDKESSGLPLSCAFKGWECRRLMALPSKIVQLRGLELQGGKLLHWQGAVDKRTAKGKMARPVYGREQSQDDPWLWSIPLYLVSPRHWQFLLHIKVAVVYPNLASVSSNSGQESNTFQLVGRSNWVSLFWKFYDFRIRNLKASIQKSSY